MRKGAKVKPTKMRFLQFLFCCALLTQICHAQLPNGWSDSDVGSVSAAGSAAFTGGAFTVSGSGSVNGTSDTMHFAYQSLSSDGSIVARVNSLAGGGTFIQAGVIIRETLNANSTYAFAFFTPNVAY